MNLSYTKIFYFWKFNFAATDRSVNLDGILQLACLSDLKKVALGDSTLIPSQYFSDQLEKKFNRKGGARLL